MNIGVLDDNPGILDYIEATLDLEGYVVSTYLTGEALLDALSMPASPDASVYTSMEAYNPRFDLVILDLLLPGKLSGADVFLALRKTFSADQLPIIVITAVDEATLEQFRRILPDDVFVLRKPFPPKVLLEAVAQVRNDRGLDEE
jgi:DNA-binding response OmpR family regulator